MNSNLNQSGQALLIILLSTLVALTVGLAITQRSLTDVANSTRIEQSTKAFSAAEAGIEKVLSNPSLGTFPINDLGNNSQAEARSSGGVPSADASNPTRHQAGLEYPEIDRINFAHFWFANPAFPDFNQQPRYNEKSFDLYFGNPDIKTNPPTDIGEYPAVEITVLSYNTGKYISTRYHLDSYNRQDTNGMCYSGIAACTGDQPSSASPLFYSSASADPITPVQSKFLCKVTIPNPTAGNSPAGCVQWQKPLGATPTDPSGTNAIPILARVRVLYSSKAQKIAIAPRCAGRPPDCGLPEQASFIVSTGTAGQTQRRVSLFTQKDVVPFYFNYSLFSLGEISK